MVKIVVTAICYSSLLLICNNKAVTTAYIQQRHIDNVVRDNNNMIYDVDRPLVPPFPNGACGGTVVTYRKMTSMVKITITTSLTLNFLIHCHLLRMLCCLPETSRYGCQSNIIYPSIDIIISLYYIGE